MKKILILMILLPNMAHAKADPSGGHAVDLGMSITLIQCGHSSEMEQTCLKEQRCCIFVNQGLEDHMCEIFVTPEKLLPVCVRLDKPNNE